MHKIHMYAPDAPIGFMSAMMDVVAEAKGKSLDEGALKWLPIKRTVYLLASLMVMCGNLKRKVSWLYRWTRPTQMPAR
jgi:hypothetical protein